MQVNLEDQYDRIYRYCYFRVKKREIAEDLAQEAFLRYFSRKPRISRGRSMAYLYTIARNLCIDHFRKVRRDDSLDDRAPDPYDSDGFSEFENEFAVKQAVAQLPAELQELLLLRFANELGIGEIAKIMNMSRFSVYRRINRALELLKTILGEEEP